MSEFNKELCDNRHTVLERDIDRAHEKIGDLSKVVVKFYIAVIATLISVLANLFISVFKIVSS
jgi:hypothetical protein